VADSILNRRIATDLRRKIVAGTLAAGDRLTQEQVADDYHCSVDTVRLAFAQLANEGLVDRRPGRYGGTFVRARTMLTHYASRAELAVGEVSESDLYGTEVQAQGYLPTQKLTVEACELDVDIAERLEVEEGARGVARRCLRFVNGIPTSTADSYYPPALVEAIPELAEKADVKEGTTRLMDARGHGIVAYRDEVSARMPTPAEVKLLDLGAGTPVMVFIRTAITRDGPARVTVTTYAADRNRMVYTLGDPSRARGLPS